MSMDISYIKKINKETSALNSILEKIDLTNTYRTFPPKATEYTFFFPCTVERFQDKSHGLITKQVLNLKGLKSYQAFFQTQ